MDAKMEAAKGICMKHKALRCGPCVKELHDHFKGKGKILRIDVRDRSNRHFISHKSGHGQSISHNGQHFGYEINGIVFGNVHTEGIDRNLWPSSFEYVDNETNMPTKVTEKIITVISFTKFTKYSGAR